MSTAETRLPFLADNSTTLPAYINTHLSAEIQLAQIMRQHPELVVWRASDEDEAMLPARHSAQEQPEFETYQIPQCWIVAGREYHEATAALEAAMCELEIISSPNPAMLELSEIELEMVQKHGLGFPRYYDDRTELGLVTLRPDGLWHWRDTSHLFLEDAIRATEKRRPESTYPEVV